MIVEIDRSILGGATVRRLTTYRPIPCSGQFVNITEAGYRRIGNDVQGPLADGSRSLYIFFFGGSTTLNVGPDWTAIPRHLQDET